MKTILIHSLTFSPDGVSTAYLYNDIALQFKEYGFNVIVLTSTPHYNIVTEAINKQPLRKKLFGLYSVSNYHGIKVYHIPQKKFNNTILRILGFTYWHFLTFILAVFMQKIDLILSPSPPLTIGFLNIITGKIKSAKVIYNVQEIYPDLLIEKGGLNSKFIISILKWLEKFIYNKSDSVTTIDEVFYSTIVSRFKDKSKLHIIPNFIDTALYKPIKQKDLNLDPLLFQKSDSLKIMYAGNIGHAQDWSIFIEIAKNLADSNIEFHIIGEGVMKESLINEVTNNGLNKVKILPYQPRESIPSILNFADLHFIFMTQTTEGHGFPSKVYSLMACSKPILISSGENTPITNFLANQEFAFCFSDNKISQRAEKIVSLLKTLDKNRLQDIGITGREIIEKEYSIDVVTTKYINLANQLTF